MNEEGHEMIARMLVMQIEGNIDISSPSIVQNQDFFFLSPSRKTWTFLESTQMTQLMTSQVAGQIQPQRAHLP